MVDRRRLSDEDIDLICNEFDRRIMNHHCKFIDITPDDVRNSLRITKEIDTFKTISWNVIWKTFLTLGVVGMVGWVFSGVIAKLKTALGL